MLPFKRYLPIGDWQGISFTKPLPLTYWRVAKSKIDIFVIEQVKIKRLEKNISQAHLAFELGVSVGFIGKVESPKYNSHYNIRHLNELAKILKCSPQEFMPKKPQ